MLELARQFEHAYRSGARSDEVHAIDLALHGMVLQMTGSRLVSGMQDVLTRFFQSACKDDRFPADEASVWQHHDLATAIRDRDLERARAILRSHWHPLLQIPSVSQSNAER